MICPNCKKSILKKAIEIDKKKDKKKKKKSKKGSKQEEPIIKEAIKPTEFERKSKTLTSKMEGKVRVKKKTHTIDLDKDKIEFQKGEYIKLLGIVSVDRTPLYCSNENYLYLLELTSNLDFIATSILGGTLDKMLLIAEDNSKEKCQWATKNNLIFIVYGIFPDKKGKWIIEQMDKHFSQLVIDKDVNALDKFDKYQIDTKFKAMIKFILEEYLIMQEIFSDKEIPYVEDKIRIDYLGLSSKSIGVVSLLLGEKLNVEVPGVYDDPNDELEMKESVLTAKIEAIAANTIGNTRAMPKWIAVKLGFQSYRFLTFNKYKNDYFLYFLSEGNLGKIEKAKNELEPYLSHVVDEPFKGNLKPFNRLKTSLKEFFDKKQIFS